ncbi:hypothetical protein DIPPA_30516 [Diplonema papillatum]|nr:hypothetical protein DIPPA_30516 [Diplonema papillatum]
MWNVDAERKHFPAALPRRKDYSAPLAVTDDLFTAVANIPKKHQYVVANFLSDHSSSRLSKMLCVEDVYPPGTLPETVAASLRLNDCGYIFYDPAPLLPEQPDTQAGPQSRPGSFSLNRDLMTSARGGGGSFSSQVSRILRSGSLGARSYSMRSFSQPRHSSPTVKKADQRVVVWSPRDAPKAMAQIYTTSVPVIMRMLPDIKSDHIVDSSKGLIDHLAMHAAVCPDTASCDSGSLRSQVSHAKTMF